MPLRDIPKFMLITDALFGEHAVFYLFLGHIEQALPALDSLSALQHRFAAFTFALEAHAGLEDELLFTALEPHLGTQAGPLAVMRFEHDQALFRMARQFLSEDELTSLGGQWAKRRTPLIGLGMP